MNHPYDREGGVRRARIGAFERPGLEREWCADEVAIDFPAIPAAVDRIRATLGGDDPVRPLHAVVRLSPREAFDGVGVPLDVPLRGACPACGGRGESWMEPCLPCDGTGDALFHHRVCLLVPARVTDGARFRFKVTSPQALPTRVDVQIAIR